MCAILRSRIRESGELWEKMREGERERAHKRERKKERKTESLSLALFPSLSFSRSLSLAFFLSLSFSRSPSLALFLSLSFSLFLSLSLTLFLSLSFSRSFSIALALLLSLSFSGMLTLSLVLLVVFHSKGSTVNWSFNWIFRKISKRPWTPPPPHFRKVMLQIFSEIHDRSIIYNGKNLQHNFLDWKWTPPPGTFPKIHPFWKGKASLRGRPLCLPPAKENTCFCYPVTLGGQNWPIDACFKAPGWPGTTT